MARPNKADRDLKAAAAGLDHAARAYHRLTNLDGTRAPGEFTLREYIAEVHKASGEVIPYRTAVDQLNSLIFREGFTKRKIRGRNYYKAPE